MYIVLYILSIYKHPHKYMYIFKKYLHVFINIYIYHGFLKKY